MTAPYVIRDQLGYWHDYQLPIAKDQQIGVSLIIYLQPGETLDCPTILAALKPALYKPPPGTWYLITVPERNIREKPTSAAKLITTLKFNEMVLVSEIVTVFPLQKWGKVISIKRKNVETSLWGFIFLSQLRKV